MVFPRFTERFRSAEVVFETMAIYSAAMFDRTQEDIAGDTSASDDFAAFQTLAGDVGNGLLLICDHARNTLPMHYGTLGLDRSSLERHIAYDIGVEAVTVKLARSLNAPAVLSGFSRLLIDPNRGADDPTLVMKLSDGAIIPGNHPIEPVEVEQRRKLYYTPYHDAITREIDRAIHAGKPPAILSIHSFTPFWRGRERPWHAAVLWDKDPRFARPLIDVLQADSDLIVGDNEPYSGRLKNDCLYRHGTQRGLAHALLEIRQDLISNDTGIEQWVSRLQDAALKIVETQDGLHNIKYYGSHND